MKNFVCEGDTLEFIAPTGGVTAGKPVKIDALTVVPMESANAGSPFTGRTSGVYRLACTSGLLVGAMVKWDGTTLVADAAKDADDFGKLVSSEVDGFAEALIVQ